jgi:hypothetical protein
VMEVYLLAVVLSTFLICDAITRDDARKRGRLK